MIDNDYLWNFILYMALGTIMIRSSVIAISSKIKISDRVKEIFSFIPAAVLPTLAAPMVFFHEGQVASLMGKERFLILVAATVVAYYAKSMLATIAFGLVSLFILTQL